MIKVVSVVRKFNKKYYDYKLKFLFSLNIYNSAIQTLPHVPCNILCNIQYVLL